jgi:hypothetical protein
MLGICVFFITMVINFDTRFDAGAISNTRPGPKTKTLVGTHQVLAVTSVAAAAMWVLQAMYHASFCAADTLKLLPLL